MNLELALIFAFIFHLLGDYIFQNHWMAIEKTKRNFPALVHAFIYSLPFLLLCPSPLWLVIFGTHFLIDRYRLAVYWIRFINNGWQSQNFGYPEDTPKWLSTWLVFIIDNIFHIVINAATIYLHFTI